MLKKFTVRNFKQFDSLTIDFSKIRDYGFQTDCLTKKSEKVPSLVKTALVLGTNASGKSNLGFALVDIVQHLQDLHTEPYAYEDYLNADKPQEPAFFSYTFLLGGKEILYEYSKLSSKALTSERFVINGHVLFHWDDKKDLEDFKGLTKYKLNKLNISNWQSQKKEKDKPRTISFLRYLANNSILTDRSPVRQVMTFVEKMLWFRRVDKNNNFIGFHPTAEKIDEFIIRKNLVKKFEKFLNEVKIPGEIIADLAGPDSRTLYFKHSKPLSFFQTASSGTIALAVYFYWKQFFHQCSFIFMDEFDAFYDVTISRYLIEEIKKLKCQCILTSHNISLLNHNLIRPDACFLINNGSLNSFSDSTSRELREGNNLQKLYIGGEFNG